MYIKTFLIIYIVLTGNFLFGQNSGEFKVEVCQKGKKVEQNIKTVELKSKKFDIVFTFSNPTDLLISASFDPTTYNEALNNISFSELTGFKETGMAEGLNNLELELFISKSAPSMWFYYNEENNRFNITEKKNNQIYCTRTIETIYDVDSKSNLKLKKIEKPIFIVFISYQYDKEKGRIELHRETLRINLR